jgi:hypothetical protein
MFLRPLCLLFLAFSISGFSQTFTISGIISEQGSGETLPGVSVYCPQSKTGNSSNNYGFYSITLQGDTAQLIFTFLGYTPQQIRVSKNAASRLDIALRKADLELQTVEISATRDEKISEVSQMSRIEIPIEQIKKIPALFGEKDVLKVIQLLPGVQKGSEGSSGFYVRGGGPDQNLIILDDAVVYNANHLFGFFSIFNGDALKSVELTKGGFPARYGGRLSSVLEMQMKDGNKEQLHGEAGIGLISSRLTLEGPIQKNTSSFLVSGRRTYIDALVYPFLPAESKGGYFFYDFNAKAHFILNENDRLYLSGYFGKDKFYFKSTAEDKSVSRGSFLWQNATATARFNHIINKKAFSNTSIIFSRYNLGINSVEEPIDGDAFELNFSSGIRDWTLKHDFDYFPNTKHHVRLGAALTYHRFTPNAVVIKGEGSSTNADDSEVYDCLENGLYAEDDWTLNDKIKINVGIRGSHFLQSKRNYFGVEPRFSGRYLLNDKMSLKASYALMNQYLHLLSNTGIGLPTDLWVPATDRVAPQRSHQVALGLAKDISAPELSLSAEAYYKTMNNIIGYKEGASFLSAFEFGGTETISWQDNVTPGTGQSYGAELMVQRKTGRLTGWVGYTLSWTIQQFDELNNGEPFFARYDRRHDLSIVAIYEIKPSLTLSATWVYGTGQAVTLPLAQYQVNPHDPATDGNPSYLMYTEDFGAKNSFRMAPYHRLDIAAQWHKKLKRSERTFELGVYNAYNRKNPFFYYIDSKADGSRYLSQISLFPILPSVSWTYKF